MIGALIVPDARLDRLFKSYSRLRKQLSKTLTDEVKGSALSPDQIARVIALVARHRGVFCSAAIDLAHLSKYDIELQRQRLIRAFSSALQPGIPAHHASQIRAFNAVTEAISPQLYVQAEILWALINRIIADITVFYAIRSPRELGSFSWRIDAKGDTGVTKSEAWWTSIMLPIIQSRSHQNPLQYVQEGNYRHFDRYRGTIDPGQLGPEFSRVVLLEKLFADLSFPRNNAGIELADILTNATRRTLRKELPWRSWRELPNLMMDRGEQYVQLISLVDVEHHHSHRYDDVLMRMSIGGQRLIPPARRGQ